MDTNYSPRYTPCGHSIKALKNEARALQKRLSISLIEALDLVARRIKYADWNELIRQEANPTRDEFFRQQYKTGPSEEPTVQLYQEYLKHNGLRDGKESFRQFSVAHWQNFQQAGFEHLTLDREPMLPEVLEGEICGQLERYGAHGLMPSRMGAQLLETIIFIGRAIRSGGANLPDEAISGYLQQAMNIVMAITAFQKKSDPGPIQFDEFMERVEEFYLIAELELISRRTGIQVIAPDINKIFSKDATFEVRPTRELREFLKA